MAMISTTGACKNCQERTGFTRKDLDESNPLQCRRCGAAYAQAYEHQNRRASMSSRHVKDFFCEGHEISQLNPKDFPGRERIAYSRSEYDRKVAAAGLDPDSGGFKYATNSGYAPTDDDPSQL